MTRSSGTGSIGHSDGVFSRMMRYAPYSVSFNVQFVDQGDDAHEGTAAGTFERMYFVDVPTSRTGPTTNNQQEVGPADSICDFPGLEIAPRVFGRHAG